jgi:hypothetical protein
MVKSIPGPKCGSGLGIAAKVFYFKVGRIFIVLPSLVGTKS